MSVDESNDFVLVPDKVSEPVPVQPRIKCRVSRLDNGENCYYLAPDKTYKVGDRVVVPPDKGEVTAIVLSVEPTSDMSLPEIVRHDLKWLLCI